MSASRKQPQERKCRVLWICLLLSAAFFLSSCQRQDYSRHTYNGSVSVVIGMGARAAAVFGRPIPVTVTVTGEYASAGHRITLTVPKSEEASCCYIKTIEEGRQTYIFYAEPGLSEGQMIVEIENSRQNVVYSRTSSYQYAVGENLAGEVMIGMAGIAADYNLWNLSYGYGEAYIQIRSVLLLPENLLGEKEAYEAYDLLVFTEESAGSLTAAQKEAVCAYAKDGGSLLFLGDMYTAETMGMTGLRRKGLRKIKEDMILISYQSDTGDFWTADPSLLREAISEDLQIQLADLILGGITGAVSRSRQEADTYEEVTGLLGGMDKNVSPVSVRRYAILFLFYLFYLLPGIWILLKAKNRIRFFRSCIGLCAVLMSILVWIAGTKTRITDPWLNLLILKEYENGEEQETIYAGIQSPFNNTYTVSFSPDYRLDLLPEGKLQSGVSYQTKLLKSVMIEEKQMDTEITREAPAPFTSDYYILEKSREFPAPVRGDISETEKGLSGLLKNEGTTNLEDVILVYKEEIYILGDLKKGEGIDLAELSDSSDFIHTGKELFESGSFRRPDSWNSDSENCYRWLLRSSEEGGGELMILARAYDSDAFLQKNTAFEQKELTVYVIRPDSIKEK